MSRGTEGIKSPYVGPRPFEREDGLLFGRDREVRELVSLVVSHRVVILYAASGAGKTSLLNAGLLPVLEAEEGFEVLPVARLRPLDPKAATRIAVRNVYTFGVMSNWGGAGSSDGDGDPQSDRLAAVLARHEHAMDDQGFAAPRVVVFDQFEELFSLFPERWRDRAAFLNEVAEALEQDPLLRVVMALREDYLAQLDAHAALLPGALRTRLRVERLGPAAARAAIERPLEGTGRAFADEAAHKLVADLRTVRVDSALGDAVQVEGEYIEPVHLQVACQSLWWELPADVTTITVGHLRTFGDVDEALSRFCDEAIREAADAAPIEERRLRQSLEDAFLTAGGTRATVYRGASSTTGIPNRAIDELENQHLLRAEWRAGARWYELTHDRLVEPLQDSNRAFTAARRRRRNRRLLKSTASLLLLGLIASQVLIVRVKSPVEGRPDAPFADFSSVDMVAGVSLARFLDRVGSDRESHSPVELRRLGVMTTYSVTLRHAADRNLPFVTVVNDERNQPVSRQQQRSLRPQASNESIQDTVWVPTPRSAGLYQLTLEIRAPGKRPRPNPLDTITTGTFAGLDGRGSDSRVVNVNFSIKVGGSGTGTVRGNGVSCPPVCTVVLPRGSRLTMVATPARGSNFLGWSGSCAGAATCTVVVGPSTHIRARFAGGTAP